MGVLKIPNTALKNFNTVLKNLAYRFEEYNQNSSKVYPDSSKLCNYSSKVYSIHQICISFFGWVLKKMFSSNVYATLLKNIIHIWGICSEESIMIQVWGIFCKFSFPDSSILYCSFDEVNTVELMNSVKIVLKTVAYTFEELIVFKTHPKNFKIIFCQKSVIPQICTQLTFEESEFLLQFFWIPQSCMNKKNKVPFFGWVLNKTLSSNVYATDMRNMTHFWGICFEDSTQTKLLVFLEKAGLLWQDSSKLYESFEEFINKIWKESL